ncbi:hypothetical protein D3C83_215410 [compost metagenome]
MLIKRFITEECPTTKCVPVDVPECCPCPEGIPVEGIPVEIIPTPPRMQSVPPGK